MKSNSKQFWLVLGDVVRVVLVAGLACYVAVISGVNFWIILAEIVLVLLYAGGRYYLTKPYRDSLKG